MTFGLDLGGVRIDQVTEVDRWVFPPAEMFPEIAVQAPGASDAELVLAIHTYVVRYGGLTVLIDAGNGNGKQRPVLLAHHEFATDFLDRLASVGVQPEDVDVVVVTHLHPDHAGGLTVADGNTWRPTFPRAVHLFDQQDLDALRQLTASSPDGILGDLAATFRDSIEPVLQSGNWRAIDSGHRIFDTEGATLTVNAAPGHTNGHFVVELRTQQQTAIFSGDVIHDPIQLRFPNLVQGGDSEPDVARRTRDGLLDRCVEENLLLLTAHFGGDRPFVVHATDGGGHALVPVDV